MKRINLRQRLSFAILGALCILFFNNCSQPSFDSMPYDDSSSSQSAGLPEGTPPAQNDPPDDQNPIPNPTEPPPVPPPVIEPPPTMPPPTQPPAEPPPTEPPPPTSGMNGAAFLAVGHMNTSLYTCDGGRTWRGYRTANAGLRCWDQSSGNHDCDHNQYSSLGVTWGPEGFMATYGWGAPGHVEISRNGNSWTRVHQGRTWAGVAFGNDTYILNERDAIFSMDGGTSWTAASYLNFIPWNARKIYFVDQGPGLFISLAQSGNVQDLMVSRDSGRNFRRPTSLPSGCGNGLIAGSESRIVLLSTDICISDDQGETWRNYPGPPSVSEILYDGLEFKAYGGRQVYRSADGINWTSQDLNISGSTSNTYLNFERVSFHPMTRQYVAISQAWGRYYEQTQYLFSSDGINWQQVNKSSGAAPVSAHPIRAIAPGYLESCE